MSELQFSEEIVNWNNNGWKLPLCSICKLFKSTSRHEMGVQPFDCESDNAEIYFCKDCAFITDMTVVLKQHVLENHVGQTETAFQTPKETRNYYCSNCSFETYSILIWFKHVAVECLYKDSLLEIIDCSPEDFPGIGIKKELDEDDTIQIQPDISCNINPQHQKKSSARVRPTICPICHQDVITHFPRHLLRHHKDHKYVKQIANLKPGSKDRLAIVAALRKKGYFHLKTEKDIVHPARTSKDSNSEYFMCNYCLGHYIKNRLYKHVKVCKSKPSDVINPSKNCLSRSQTFMATFLSKNHDYLRTSRVKQEVFTIMRADNISLVAKNDPLICFYGEALLNKQKRRQTVNVISNKIREMARLLIALKHMINDISGLFDVMKPEMFTFLISAVKVISGYDDTKKKFQAPSLALHMGTNLKIICDVSYTIVTEKRTIPNISYENREEKIREIIELKNVIEAKWCSEISSQALKDLKEKKWEQPYQFPLASDILTFQKYLDNMANKAHEKLKHNVDVVRNYKILTESVLVQTVMFNRNRVGNVQKLKTETYRRKNHDPNDQDEFTQSLTTVEKIISKNVKRVVTEEEESRPTLFTKRTQTHIKTLIALRENINMVPKSNPYLFANPGSETKYMAGANVIRRLAQNCGAKRPALLTSTKFRKHIATTFQLLTMQRDELEQVARFMGHTENNHTEFYRLPQDVYQTSKVAKVLLLLEKGRGKEFQGKTLNEIELDQDISYSSESDENEELSNVKSVAKEDSSSVNGDLETPMNGEELLTSSLQEEVRTQQNRRQFQNKSPMTISGRIRWTNAEKEIVLNHFKEHIINKIAPKKYECQQVLNTYKEQFKNKDWVRVKAFVYNSFRKR